VRAIARKLLRAARSPRNLDTYPISSRAGRSNATVPRPLVGGLVPHFICAHAASSGRIPRPGTLDVVVTLGCALLRAIRSLRPPQPGVARAASGGTSGAGKPELPE
jgi:hypothetical protein